MSTLWRWMTGWSWIGVLILSPLSLCLLSIPLYVRQGVPLTSVTSQANRMAVVLVARLSLIRQSRPTKPTPEVAKIILCYPMVHTYTRIQYVHIQKCPTPQPNGKSADSSVSTPFLFHSKNGYLNTVIIRLFVR